MPSIRGSVVRKYISVPEAQELFYDLGYGTITRTTLYRWCETEDFGKKVRGRWKVDRNAFLIFLES